MENKEEQVRNIATMISEMYNLTPPVEFNKIFESGDCILKKQEMAEFLDGYTDLDKIPPEVFINDSVTYERRKRFTIAHELGHVYISWHGDVTTECQTDNYLTAQNKLDIQELEANIFASELLMPCEWLKEKLRIYKNYSLRQLLEKLSLEAETSIMACIYALPNAFDPGNVMIVKRVGFDYGRKFISKGTCKIPTRGISLEEFYEKFSLTKEIFDINNYQVKYYKFFPCPSMEEVVQAYAINNDFENMLKSISDNSILNIVYCLNTIIKYIPDNYYVAVHNEKRVISSIEDRSSIKFQPNISIERLKNQVSSRFEEYGEITLSENLSILWIKEPIFIESDLLKKSTEDSRKLLKEILAEIYFGDDKEKKSRSINGVIGITNSINKNVTREKLYVIMKISLENRIDLTEFAEHRDFEKFISLRLNEIFKRNKRTS